MHRKNKKQITKIKTIILFAACLVYLTGCGQNTTSTIYSYSPSFTRDSKIIFVGTTMSDSNTAEYVKTIYANGTGESAVLFYTTDNSPYYMSASPGRDYVAYLNGLSNNTFDQIIIQNIASGTHTDLGKVELDFFPRILSFDWSSDANKLVYCTTNEVRVRDWNDYTGATDALVTRETDVTSVSWKYGDRIAFTHTSGSDNILSFIYSDASNRIDLATAVSLTKVQISPSNTAEAYGVASGNYYKVDFTAAAPALTLIKAGFTGQTPRISPDASRTAYSKASLTSGLFVLYLSTGTEETIKN